MFVAGSKVTFAFSQPSHDETNRPWYDTKEGIQSHVGTLAQLHEVLDARHEASYGRQERLNEYYLLGRFHLDQCGNCSKGELPKPLVDVPAVATHDEFWRHAKEQLGEDTMISFALNGGNIPLPGLTCAHCRQTWNVENCADTVVYHSHETFPLTTFAGQTLAEVKGAYAERTDAIYRTQPDVLIRHDRFIDLSPEYPEPREKWQEGAVKNKRGWMSAKKGIDDTYVIEPGDELFINVWRYFHQACNRAYLAETEERSFKELFEKAGYQKIALAARPNEYCSCEKCAPWFDVATEVGTFKIGWRKRVINIQCPQGADGTHAGGWEKAEEYLRTFRSLQ